MGLSWEAVKVQNGDGQVTTDAHNVACKRCRTTKCGRAELSSAWGARVAEFTRFPLDHCGRGVDEQEMLQQHRLTKGIRWHCVVCRSRSPRKRVGAKLRALKKACAGRQAPPDLLCEKYEKPIGPRTVGTPSRHQSKGVTPVKGLI